MQVVYPEAETESPLASVTQDAEYTPEVLFAESDGTQDVFFAQKGDVWTSGYCAQHVGFAEGWEGTGEIITLAGKNRLSDIFVGGDDANVLLMTDDANGDALFVDDIYTNLPGDDVKPQSRIAQINEIRAGAGDDIVDMTSQRFDYIGDGVIIRGGDGDDVIWANGGNNYLFGDAGNDRLVGASGDDVFVGGIGNDAMHGGGGRDVFIFCDNWGVDTVEQLADGSVTLWFASGSYDNWDEATLTYTSGNNSVTVTGVDANKVTLYFGEEGFEYIDIGNVAGVFAECSSENVFEEKGRGFLTAI